MKPYGWLTRRPRYHAHFTPTSASWINQVERWFSELTRKQLRRDAHSSVKDIEADIMSFIEKHNESPKPFKPYRYPRNRTRARSTALRALH